MGRTSILPRSARQKAISPPNSNSPPQRPKSGPCSCRSVPSPEAPERRAAMDQPAPPTRHWPAVCSQRERGLSARAGEIRTAGRDGRPGGWGPRTGWDGPLGMRFPKWGVCALAPPLRYFGSRHRRGTGGWWGRWVAGGAMRCMHAAGRFVSLDCEDAMSCVVGVGGIEVNRPLVLGHAVIVCVQC